MYKLLIGILMLLAIGCGTVVFDIDTDISPEGAITHALTMELSSPLFIGVEEDTISTLIDDSVLPNTCDITHERTTIKVACPPVPHITLFEPEELDLNLLVSESEDETRYSFRAEQFFEAESLGMDDLELVQLTMSWTINMPGKIDQSLSNADSYDGSAARFDITPEDTRSEYQVVSIVRESSGACGAPTVQ